MKYSSPNVQDNLFQHIRRVFSHDENSGATTTNVNMSS